MIADDQVLLPLELPEVLLGRLFISEHQVTKDIDRVVIGYFSVPLLDEDFIHLIDAFERPVAESDNVSVTQVQITYEEDYVPSPHFLF